MKISKKIKTATAIIIAVIIVLAGGIFTYTSDYYRADTDALAALQSAEAITVTQTDGAYIFTPDEFECGLIFYPGGKVEYTAYAPLLSELAKRGILCILVEMPLNLAVLDTDAADDFFGEFPDIKSWYIGGHSLGGSMAASYASDNTDKLDGLILLASYSTADLSGTDLDVVSVFGSNDGVLNMDKYNEYRSNLPYSTTEKIIIGGCHAYFGNYGVQESDGIPTVTKEEQLSETVETIIENIK